MAFQDEVWVIGGFDDRSTMLSTVEIYSPSDQTWRAGPDLPLRMHHANAAVVGESIWIVGFLVGGFNADGRIFELSDNTWIDRGSMPQGRERGASVMGVDGTDIYIAGGLDGGAVDRFDKFDTQSLTFETLAELPSPMDHGAGAFMDGKMVIVGGRNTSVLSHTNAVHLFDPMTNQWSSGAPMPTSRAGVAHAVHKGRLFVVGGEGNTELPSGVFDALESYDPATDTWSVHEPMINPRHGMGAASIGNLIFVPGGAAVQAFGATEYSDAFQF